MKKYYVYIALSTVFLLSIAAGYLFQAFSLHSGFAGTAIAALVGGLFKIARDEAAYQKDRELQKQQHVFTLGTTSHMANVAFDKHVEFCEKYIAQLHKAIVTLFANGPTERALDHANQLYNLRTEYAAWLTQDVNNTLDPFEKKLREVGAGERFIRTTADSERHGQDRHEMINKIHSIVLEFLGEHAGVKTDADHQVEAVMEKVRAILGVEELTQIRRKLISTANDTLQ